MDSNEATPSGVGAERKRILRFQVPPPLVSVQSVFPYRRSSFRIRSKFRQLQDGLAQIGDMGPQFFFGCLG